MQTLFVLVTQSFFPTFLGVHQRLSVRTLSFTRLFLLPWLLEKKYVLFNWRTHFCVKDENLIEETRLTEKQFVTARRVSNYFPFPHAASHSLFSMLPLQWFYKLLWEAGWRKREHQLFFFKESTFLYQVNGAFDLPQVQLSGISTPYVRVHLLPGQRHKDTRSNFLNLGTNRICMFDQITLQEAQR